MNIPTLQRLLQTTFCAALCGYMLVLSGCCCAENVLHSAADKQEEFVDKRMEKMGKRLNKHMSDMQQQQQDITRSFRDLEESELEQLKRLGIPKDDERGILLHAPGSKKMYALTDKRIVSIRGQKTSSVPYSKIERIDEDLGTLTLHIKGEAPMIISEGFGGSTDTVKATILKYD